MQLDEGPPFRAEHVGSLLRPPRLLRAKDERTAGNISAAELAEVEDDAVRDAISLQEDIGLKVITDGEFRRHIYFGHFAGAVDGFEEMEAEMAFKDESGKPMTYRTDVVTSRLRRVRGIATGEYKFVQHHTSRTPKVTLPSPGGMHYFRWHEGISEQAYPDIEEFYGDLVAIYRAELRGLAEVGARYVQFDDVALALLCDPDRRAEAAARGYDPDELVARYIEVTNAMLEERPENMVVAMHLCRGNNQGKWLGAGGYDYVAEQAFAGLRMDAFFLEYDSERSGGFEPLRYVPRDKHVVLGLVTSKTPELEDSALLERRIDEAAQYFPGERLSLSPQCGFASVEKGNPLTADDQRRKLELVVDVAGKVWT